MMAFLRIQIMNYEPKQMEEHINWAIFRPWHYLKENGWYNVDLSQ